jgi:1,4-alpha-glucan branching enzyme
MYPHLHRAEDRMIRAASEAASDASGEAHCSPSERRALNQAARELMLAQSSDWAFILDAGTVTAYARQRFREHLQRFHRLLDQWQSRQIDETELERLEKLSALLPRLSYEWFCANADKRSSANGSPTLPSKPPNTNPDRITVLMLAWEYPPRIIGGLARAVCDLSRHLAAKGHEVHVITCTVSGSPAYEAAEGVHVHRVPVLQSLRPVHFADWVFQMNVAFADYAAKLLERLSADILHAHDWLVCYAATEMQHSFRLPLVSTIHATEYGRNGGRIESPLQRRIHGLEQHLVRSSDQVITCSRAMHEEVRRVFRLPEANMHMIPNGIDLPAALEEERRPLQPHDRFMNLTGDAPFIFFIGRLVREKGVQVLLKAMPLVWQTFPETSLVIAGEGPMREKLQQLAAPMGDRIRFTGFLAQTEKQYFLRQAELCVIPSLYEPFGIVALEAMAAGTPVIVSATGGLAEIVEHEIDGLKASPGDHVSLARQIAGLLQNREQASKLRTNALRKVRERYDLCRIADATRQVYECALEKHRGIKTSERGIIK